MLQKLPCNPRLTCLLIYVSALCLYCLRNVAWMEVVAAGRGAVGLWPSAQSHQPWVALWMEGQQARAQAPKARQAMPRARLVEVELRGLVVLVEPVQVALEMGV